MSLSRVVNPALCERYNVSSFSKLISSWFISLLDTTDYMACINKMSSGYAVGDAERRDPGHK
jgi:hypothetical protein